jgi:hypothetical protein
VPLKADEGCRAEVRLADCLECSRQRIRFLSGRGWLSCLLPDALNPDPRIPRGDDRRVFSLDDFPGSTRNIDGIVGLTCAVGLARPELQPLVEPVKRTYIGSELNHDSRPYDWYRALVIAGAIQHGLPSSWIATLEATEFIRDLNPQRRQRALDTLTKAGYPQLLVALPPV